MSTVSAHELPEEMLSLVERARDGEEIEITEGDTVVASIAPKAPHPLSDLIASGDLRPPVLSGPIPPPTGPVRTTDEAGALMERMRDEERY